MIAQIEVSFLAEPGATARGMVVIDPGTTRSGRLIAIGDIHGHAIALRRLLKLIAPQPADVIVTLGDYINRGPDSRGVFDALLDLQQQCQLIPLLGNHEEMLLDSRHDRVAEQAWRAVGGVETLASYGAGNSLGLIPLKHWNLLETCQPCFETEAFLFVHANYCWYSPASQQPPALLRWLSIDESVPRPHISGKTVILGHLPGPIRDLGFCRCLDTGCGFGGRLTAMDVETRQCWQVTETGAVVAAHHIE